MNVLFAASELFPLVKTGGLGDVAHSLPNALSAIGVDMRVVLPAYRRVLEQVDSMRALGWLSLSGGREARVLEAHHADMQCPLWLIDDAPLFDRTGAPYTNAAGHDWPDNPARFTAFSEAVAALALDTLELGWRADAVHANDWQTGLVAAFLALHDERPQTIFTVHNIAYDCQVDFATFQSLHLPSHWWSVDYGEFYDRLSMLKCGLVFSDRITTVSPRYAQEIRTAEYGYGYASILEANAHKLTGILNGIDDEVWNPATDPHLVAHYQASGKIRAAKRANRKALLEALEVPQDALEQTGPLIGSVGRLVYQKGIDLLLDIIPAVVESSDAQFVLIGSGETTLEDQLRTLSKRYPAQIFSFIGYSESMAHLLEAGCDMFAMPSRYEPCGLNQMYSMRYGTPPVVRDTGGLADTVEHASPRSLARGEATGFVFSEASSEGLRQCLDEAIDLFHKPKQWMKLVRTGMRRDFGWHTSAAAYLALYQTGN